MRPGLVAFTACAALLAASAPARAQGSDDATGGVPPEFERIEISDLSATVRDDNFSTITLDPNDPATAYVGTFQGRIYKTTDRGQTWTESTVLTEPPLLWATSGSSIYFGSIRGDGGGLGPGFLDLGAGGNPTLGSSDVASNLIGSAGSPVTFPYVNTDLPKLVENTPFDPLQSQSQIASGAGGAFLGVGLSSRSPRLSILTAARGKPVPVLNRQRLLIDRTLRGLQIMRITIDPDNSKLMFAATVNGLYKSYDGGLSWARAFAGLTPAEKLAIRVAIRPGPQKLIILGTLRGAYTSVDNGDNWSKITTLGDVAVNEVAFDARDNDLIYLATNGGVFRSADGGRSWILVYYSTFPTEVDVRTIQIDPFDPDTAYIGTMRGAYVTHKLRTATLNDWAPLEGIQSILAVPLVAACPRHKGHLYALTRLELSTINYGADPPESAIWETWDGGKIWRPIFSGATDGSSQWFAMDQKDPDQLWIVWFTALHHLERIPPGRTARTGHRDVDPEPIGPAVAEVIFAALRFHGLELGEFAPKLASARSRSWLPSRLWVVGHFDHWEEGGKQDDNQFAKNRYLQVASAESWVVMGYASWNLPELVYSPSAQPMIRYREQTLTDEARRRVVETVRRSYGELERIHAFLASVSLDLRTRVIYQLRIEQLEAVINMTSGDYLARWQKKHRRSP